MNQGEVLTSGTLPAVTVDVTAASANQQAVPDDVVLRAVSEASRADDRPCVTDGGLHGGVAVFRKRKRRKSKKAVKRWRWKPYDKLSWKERRQLERRESKKANRVREVRFAKGQAVAPYNTTQFLMDDRNVQTPDYAHNVPSRHGNKVNSADSSDDNFSLPEDEQDFLQKQFSEVYENIHVERLDAMSKEELVQEYMQLEDRVEDMQAQLRVARAADVPAGDDDEVLEKVRIFENEIRKLIEENKKLRIDNEKLQCVANQCL